MRNVSFVIPFALLAVLGLAGCDNNAEQDAAQAERDPAATDPTMETEEQRQAAIDEQDRRMQQQDPQMQQQDPAMQTGQSDVALTVEQSSQFGEYLADSQGRPLYVYEQDSEGQSSCYDQCAENWPPLTAESMPAVDDPSIDQALLGTIQRDDGTMQVTYDDKPLYYYAEDQGAGEPTGEQGDWALADASGTGMRRVSDEM